MTKEELKELSNYCNKHYPECSKCIFVDSSQCLYDLVIKLNTAYYKLKSSEANHAIER